ncbi:FkbM family methyltransferase [Hoeflea prorocentri]|uniref:FkbM family methyltransferase n=1 Tax=Hoeflea prorocentri TaxID=1922333 RepID=A0A9X3ZH73_9HYPH|nr:FkbM family methyltransferase [Hoeflea prorocentri]MCY6380984.1 FkbM family methyltransferase [Hoeflea prorocentri]MDA5398784.1 FkbM family methyltransferase [Hoeflea prorocentri]
MNDFLEAVQPVTTQHDLIRVGADGDGGYLVPNDLAGIAACFSPGVGGIADFEADMADRGIPSFMADFSVNGPPEGNPMFNFEKRFVGTKNDKSTFRMNDWVAQQGLKETDDLLLQMDIEGAEYDVILDMPEDLLARFRILAIEFHDVQMLLKETGFRYVKAVFDKLLRYFSVVHIHPNNTIPFVEYRGFTVPPLLEFTFLRKDRIARSSPVRSLPHSLDRSCFPSNEDWALPDCWFGRR